VLFTALVYGATRLALLAAMAVILDAVTLAQPLWGPPLRSWWYNIRGAGWEKVACERRQCATL
jgi:hypothetical protein